jgi:ketosteroid isomerase-like protein
MTSHIDTVQALYGAFGRGDIPAILAGLSDNVEWEHDSADHDVPWLKPRRGRAAVGGFFKDLADLAIERFEPRSFLSSADQVAVTTAVDIVVKATGRRIRDLAIHLWTFAPDGKVARFRHFVDTHQYVLANRGA